MFTIGFIFICIMYIWVNIMIRAFYVRDKSDKFMSRPRPRTAWCQNVNVRTKHNFEMDRSELHIVVESKSYKSVRRKRGADKDDRWPVETRPLMVFAFWIYYVRPHYIIFAGIHIRRWPSCFRSDFPTSYRPNIKYNIIILGAIYFVSYIYFFDSEYMVRDFRKTCYVILTYDCGAGAVNVHPRQAGK